MGERFDEAALPAGLADDAAARWRWLIAHREAVIGAIRARTGDTGDYWGTRAAAMGATIRAAPGAIVPPLGAILPWVGPATTVLDVGAGWGRNAVPLARVARRVVAVEPSAAGVGDGRLALVAATWEAAAVEPADLVLCAHVLPPIADAAPFLAKLDRHARRRCYVVLRATAFDTPLVGL